MGSRTPSACEIVAVTGSDGKTTTTTLIAKMFEAAGRKVFLGGNIGAALLPQLPDVTPADIAVVELSSFPLVKKHWFAKLQFNSLHIKKDYFDEYYRDSAASKKKT